MIHLIVTILAFKLTQISSLIGRWIRLIIRDIILNLAKFSAWEAIAIQANRRAHLLTTTLDGV